MIHTLKDCNKMNTESQINIQELIEFIDDETSNSSANGFIQDSQMFYEVSKRLSNLQELTLTNDEIKEMNAKKLAIELTNDFYKGRTGKVMLDSATMLRQQQAEIEALKTENQELSALCVEFNVLRKANEK